MQILSVSSLSMMAAAIAILLGLLLGFFARVQKTRALGLWSVAYLLGGASAAVWSGMDDSTPWMAALVPQVCGLFAFGLVWAAARAFHGRSTGFVEVSVGAGLWAVAAIAFQGRLPSAPALMLGAGLIAIYTTLTAAELLRERRKAWRGRWPLAAISLAHGVLLVGPVVAGSVLSAHAGTDVIGSVWIMAFAIELTLYAVASAFVAVFLVTERTVNDHRAAALTDPLTGLFNRRGFADAASDLATQAGRSGRGIAVMMCDLDHFKKVNDRHGHVAGDELLQLFAQTLRDNLRTGDIVARVGGEEFAVAMTCSLGEAAIAADRVRGVYADTLPPFEDPSFETTVSIGIASGPPGTSVERMLACADVALYRAKRLGRNRVELAEDDPFAFAPSQRTPAEPGAGVPDATPATRTEAV